MTHDCDMHTPSSVCYQKHGCRCVECKRSQSKYAKQRRVRLAQNINDLVDATPAREHVEKLMSMGMSHGTIALEAGMPNAGLQPLLGLRKGAKRVERIHRRAAKRILAVAYTPAVGACFTAATGTRRRLQDLALRGFSSKELSGLCGIQSHTIMEVRRGKRLFVRVGTENAIITVHHRLEGQTSSAHNRQYVIGVAKRAGFVPLAAFDDINNQNERPKGVA